MISGRTIAFAVFFSLTAGACSGHQPEGDEGRENVASSPVAVPQQQQQGEESYVQYNEAGSNDFSRLYNPDDPGAVAPHLKYFGSWLAFPKKAPTAAQIASFENFTNVNRIYFNQLATCAAMRLGCLVDVTYQLLNEDKTLRKNYETVWRDVLMPEIEKYKGQIVGFFILDEPYFNNMTMDALETVAKTIKRSYPDKKVMTIFSPQCFDTTLNAEGHCLHVSDDKFAVPEEIDWIGFDHYYQPIVDGTVPKLVGHINLLKSRKKPKQKIFLVSESAYKPGKQSDPVVNDHYDNYLKQRMSIYFKLANAEPEVIGIMMFGYWAYDPVTWKRVIVPGVDYPKLFAEQNRIGQQIVWRQAAAGDFDKDGKADIAIKSSAGTWLFDYAKDGFGVWNHSLKGYGDGEFKVSVADFDGDGISDLAETSAVGVWMLDRGNDGLGKWDQFLRTYAKEQGSPAAADYDGDGRADVAMKTANGIYRIDFAGNGYTGWQANLPQYGDENFEPFPSDYDGDGKADIAVFNPRSGVWMIDFSSRGNFGSWDYVRNAKLLKGTAIPGDFDGDGKQDLAVIAADNLWYIDYAKNGFGPWDAKFSFPKAHRGRPVAVGDFDGDGKSDLFVSYGATGHRGLERSGDGFGNWK